MILTLDVGNTQIHGGVFLGEKLLRTFRFKTDINGTSDEIGLFLQSFLQTWGLDSETVNQVAICSVVPILHHTLRVACVKYFDREPFVIEPGVKTGLKIRYRNPAEVGADRIVNAAYAAHLFPEKNLVIVDLGTATTFCLVDRHRDYLGGMILPGVKTSQASLVTKGARLPSFPILKPEELVGRSTVESLQSGLYFGQVGAIRYMLEQIKDSVYEPKHPPMVLGTGGFCNLLADDLPLHDQYPDLTLSGLKFLLEKNLY
ncbi:type III pantothenate kinase [bacterium]|nr:type III pantothenate kinase [bacterium]